MAKTVTHTRVVILGGGFGGVRAAMDLAKSGSRSLDITLISAKPHFEYYPTMYKVVTGRSTAQVCVPLAELFHNSKVNVVEDYITEIDLEARLLKGGIGSPYGYDYLILAPGSETGYFNLPGLPDVSYGFKSIQEALALRKHLYETVAPVAADAPPEQRVINNHFMVVGAGPTGVELSAELVRYGKELAVSRGTDPSLVTVDLVEASPRVLPTFPPEVSAIVEKRLHSLGVNIFTNRNVTKADVENLYLKDMTVRTRTIVWSAGVSSNRLLKAIKGLELDKRGRVVVDGHLQAKGHKGVFVIGDAASTQYAGLAQTANSDASFAAYAVLSAASKKPLPTYVAHKPIYAVPTGHGWAAVVWGPFRFYGRFGGILRELADLRYFLGILPPHRALRMLMKGNEKSRNCAVCAHHEEIHAIAAA